MKKELIYQILIFSIVILSAAGKGFGQTVPLSSGELALAKTYYNVQEALTQKAIVQQLNIRQQSYYQLPAEIGELVNLAFMNAMKNKIADVSPAIGKLQQLREVN